MSELPRAIGRYVVDKVLGRGAMGIVYKAHDPEIDRPVAIKLVRMDLLDGGHAEDYLARFRQEVQAAGRCMHANIVGIYDFGSHEGNPFFAMEYVDGVPLDEALPKNVGLGPAGATPIVLQLLDALACAHALGVVHRDIKPANMLLSANRRIKVMDFGISKMDTSHLTQAGAVLGTPRYMSPEQFRGDPVDARSDLFSTGAVLHELLTGKPPFPGRSFEEVMVKLLHEDLELAPADALMPEAMRAVVARALAKQPGDRFDSAVSMAEVLRQAVGAAPQMADPAARTMVMHASAPVKPQPLPTPIARDPSATDPGLDDRELLATIERRLARHMGPIAGRLVRNALRDADSVEGLCERLASSIEQPPERESFLKDVHAQLLGTASVSQSRRTLVGTSGLSMTSDVANEAPLTAGDIDKVQQDLARYIGPIAKVLIKRAAPTANSVDDLRGKLAQHLEQAADRAAFLAGR
jgi:serine/threonine protein kinase